MEFIIIGLASLTFLSTLIGGTIAIKSKNFLMYIFAFASGSLIGVSFFDLLPESLSIAQTVNIQTRYLMMALVGSFFFYNLLEKFFISHHQHEDDNSEHGHIMGPIGAGSLVIHSFLDGAAIGAAYQVNPAIGLIVALAVILHDFTDGVNTVTLMLKNKHHVKNATIFLVLDALAPLAGVLSTSLITLDASFLAFLLAIFVGEFLFIGASNLLPETRKHTAWKMVLSMALGISLIFVLTSII